MKNIIAGLGLIVLAVGAVSFTGTADAASHKKRALYLRVQPKSYLDAGPVAPVGSLSQYVYVPTRYSPAPYSTIDRGFGENVLPDRIGGGRNPFGTF